MEEALIRTALLLGKAGMEKLNAARVAVFGIGGVGGYTAEALVRSGLGALDLIDNDCISESNLNRQIYATRSTIGQYKVDVARSRILDIRPEIRLTTWKTFVTNETISEFDFSQYDYVVDAIDTVTGKLAIILAARAAGVPVISSMGTGNKLDPTRLELADLSKTSTCPLARIMRKELNKRGIEHLKVVYSREKPLEPTERLRPAEEAGRRDIPGSVAFVPSVAGMILAGEVVKDLVKN
jgi:tRNA A37 threonylcarbamoyladenosine dehydratase